MLRPCARSKDTSECGSPLSNMRMTTSRADTAERKITRETALEALREEVGQSASAEYYFNGKSKLMRRGVIVRHLCLPGHRRDTEAVLRLLAAEFDPGEITLSLMRQYTPGFAPLQYRELSRCVTSFEYEFALDLAGELGFSGFSQEKDSASCSVHSRFRGKGRRGR